MDAKTAPQGVTIAREFTLDRLARNVHFVSGLMESGVDFVAVDFPQANRLTVHILAAVAEHEREAISQRTKAALAAAKRRGTKLGCPTPERGAAAGLAAVRRKVAAHSANVLPVVASIRAAGATTLSEIAAALNARGIRTSRDGLWHPSSVARLLKPAGIPVGDSGLTVEAGKAFLAV